jgi:hypothetical protein
MIAGQALQSENEPAFRMRIRREIFFKDRRPIR